MWSKWTQGDETDSSLSEFFKLTIEGGNETSVLAFCGLELAAFHSHRQGNSFLRVIIPITRVGPVTSRWGLCHGCINMAVACVAGKKFETDFKLIKQGAEAKLYEGNYLGRPTIVKERFKKSYRHVDLDNHLTKERMKSEARALLRCKIAGIHLFSLEFCRFRSRIFILWRVVCGRFIL